MVYERLFKTSIGNTVLKPEESVFSQVDGGYFEKPARDANVGEGVLFETEYVAASLDEVEPVLRLSDRYATAEQILHETNSRGAIIPRLRTNLIRGFASRGVIEEDNLEEKILRENGRDVSPESYSRMISHTSELLNRTGDGKHEDTIREWLTGDTLSPREWHIYGILRQINPEFRAHDTTNTSRAGVLYNYKLYTKIRSGIMRYLVNPRAPRHHVKGPPQGPDLTDSLEQEIQLVFEHFVREVDAKHAVAQILEITDLEKRSQWAERARKEPRLRKGVLTERNEITGGNKKNLMGILVGLSVCKKFIYGIVKDVVQLERKYPIIEKLTEEGALEKGVDWAYTLLISNMISKHIGVRGEEKFRNVSTLVMDTVLSKDELEDIESNSEECLERIYDGDIDRRLKYPIGTSFKLLDLTKRLDRVIPKSLKKYWCLYEKHLISLSQIANARLSDNGELVVIPNNDKRLQEENERLKNEVKRASKKIKEQYPFLDTYLINPEYTVQEQNEFLERNGLGHLTSTVFVKYE